MDDPLQDDDVASIEELADEELDDSGENEELTEEKVGEDGEDIGDTAGET